MVAHSSLTGTSLHSAKPRSSAASPVGVLVPAYVGELHFATDDRLLFVSTGLTTADWDAVTYSDAGQLVALIAYPSGSQIQGTNGRESTFMYPGIAAWELFAPGDTGLRVVADEDESPGVNTSYLEFTFPSGGTQAGRIEIRSRIPDAFTGWNDGGIRFFSRVVSLGATKDPQVFMEADEPGSASGWTADKEVTRTITDAETAFSATQITKAVLDANGTYAAGDYFNLRIDIGTTVGGASETIVMHLGKLELNWNDG